MASSYKLRCSLVGHEKDVRAVVPTIFPQDGIVSGSRDVTARVWAMNEHDQGFTEAHVMSGHSNFVSSVCIMPPDDKYPQGLIMTGSHDNDILAFTLESPQPQFRLTGHNDTVCALAAGKFGSLLSGSWDTTAKVWLNQKCVMELKGHEAAVWAVAIMPEGGFMLTGSADKAIKLWRAGKCERTFNGHTDCVRGLAVLSTAEFLSCSNDASVRLWAVSGECLAQYFGHSNYVYSIAILPNGRDFVTTSEDRSIKVWENGECQQTIPHPTQSVWTCCVLANGDIVTGASDGIVRVFSRDPKLQAPPEDQKAYEETLASSSIPTQVGDIKTEDLPGPEALFNPGKRDGQTMMVKDGNSIMAHQWNAAEGRWIKIGDVVGGSGGSQQSSGKVLYEGKEYDFVFDVELTEGRPALKLPYNISEDPWMAAHNWLEKNELSQMFLDQVAHFIMDQTKGVTLGQAPAAPTVSDPFTGGGRYVPGSGGGQGGGDSGSAGSSDPFTGGGRYVPGGGATYQGQMQTGADPFTGSGSYRPSYASTPAPASSAPSTSSTTNNYFPKTTYLTFDQAKMDAILNKLKEFNSGADAAHRISDEELAGLGALMECKEPTAPQLDLLWKLLQWPAGLLFPVLDVLRLAIRNATINQHFCNEKDGSQFFSFLLACLSPDAPTPNQMLVLRTLCNSCVQAAGRSLLLSQRDSLITALMAIKDKDNKHIQVAISSLLLNLAVAYQGVDDVEAKAQCLSAVAAVSESQSDLEGNFRLLVCLGTLLHKDQNAVELAKSLDIQHFVNKCKAVTELSKVAECARFIGALL